jgi:hypothetical protein
MSDGRLAQECEMTLTANEQPQAAYRLHDYLLREHWKGQALGGPDPGVCFNYRIGRFLKSYRCQSQ